MDGALKLLHPFMPFITEGIWQHLPHEGDSIMTQAWPRADEAWLDPRAEAEMAMIMETVRAIRNVRAEFEVAPSRKVDAIFHADGETATALDRNADILAHLAGLAGVKLEPAAAPKPEKAAAAVAPGVEVYLPLAGMIDIGKEIERLQRDIQSMHAEAERVRAKLGNESFVSKAPAQVVQKQRDRLADLEDQLAKVRARVAQLES